jgi:hypothetical protein
VLDHSAYDRSGCLDLVFVMLCGWLRQAVHQLVMPQVTVTVQRLLCSGLMVSVRRSASSKRPLTPCGPRW